MSVTQDFKVVSVNPHHNYDNFKKYTAIGVQSMLSDPNANPRIRQPILRYTLFTHEKLNPDDIIPINAGKELREVGARFSTFFIYQPESTLSNYFNVRKEVTNMGFDHESHRLYWVERAPLKNLEGYEAQSCEIYSKLDFQPGDLMPAQLVDAQKTRIGSTIYRFQDDRYKEILSNSIKDFCR